MLLEYVLNPNGVILAVTAANTDLAGSDVLQLARAVDPRGDHTVGVLTKLDLIPEGCVRGAPHQPTVYLHSTGGDPSTEGIIKNQVEKT